MYTSESESPIDLIKIMLQLYLEPLFYKYNVDVNLNADRLCQVLIGMAVQNLDYGSYSGAEWNKYHDQQFGYTIIFANQTCLHFKYYHNSDDKIADQFILQK